jgi:uncharacterized protein involved in tolerance to divalent cations
MTHSPADFVVVFVTMPDADTAARLGRTVVEERLAACVNVIPGLRSIYEYGESSAMTRRCCACSRPAGRSTPPCAIG